MNNIHNFTIVGKAKKSIADGFSAVANIIMILAMILSLAFVAIADYLDPEDAGGMKYGFRPEQPLGNLQWHERANETLKKSL